MVQKYYNVEKAAEVLGISEADVKEMLSNRELHGYRDGADWKFKVEVIDQLAQERGAADDASSDEVAFEDIDDGDLLLSEVEFGESDPSTSGTIIGVGDDGATPADSDINLTVNLSLDDPAASGAQFEDLDLSLDDGDLSLAPDEPDAAADTSGGGSDIELLADDLDDDDLVLGGSGAGSDITIGGDSGISLVDPADSGLSLEEPLDLAPSSESLELGEGELGVLSDAGEDDVAIEDDVAVEIETDDDFLLTPLEELDDDDSESDSQVIALDDDEPEEILEPIAAEEAIPSMGAMLDEDMGGGLDVGLADSLGGGLEKVGAGGFAEGVAKPQAAAVAAEAPYSVLNILSLTSTVLVLSACGMFMVDLLRNMWSWDGAYGVNSFLMDSILELF